MAMFTDKDNANTSSDHSLGSFSSFSSSSSSKSSSSRVLFFSSQVFLSLSIALQYVLVTTYSIPVVFVTGVALLLYTAALFAADRIHLHRIKKLPRNQKTTVFICSSAIALSSLLGCFGLSVVGSFRAVLFRYSDVFVVYSPVLFGLKTMMIGGRRLSLARRPTAKRRTASILLLSSFALLALTCSYSLGTQFPDTEKATSSPPSKDPEGAGANNALPLQQDLALKSPALKGVGFLSGVFGCLALVASAVIRFVRVRYMQSRSKEFGSLKRLKSYSVFGAAMLTAPFAVLVFLWNLRSSYLFPLASVAIYPLLAVGMFLAEDMIPEFGARLEKPVEMQSGSLVAISSALIFSLWLGDVGIPVGLSCLVAAVLMFLGLRQLTGSPLSSLPRYLESGALSASSRHKFRNWIKQVMDNRDTRRILQFLCINFLFTFVEVAYGYWTNSLGLISDAAHMLFDCTALVIGLYASTSSRMKANDEFTFGLGRYEVVSGLVNGIFLVFIAFSVFVESIERVMDPPDIRSEELLTVSILGLLVNFVGIIFFHDAHGHSHGGFPHGHSHSHGSAHNTNMEGIFLHVLADALGSVGVIVSSLMIHYWGWLVADPICSILISIMIVVSVYPLLRETSLVVLQMTPQELQPRVHELLHRVTSLPGVLGHRDAHVWSFTPGSNVGSLYLHVEESADAQEILNAVNNLARSSGVGEITVQVEKAGFINMLEPEVRTRYRMHDPHFKLDPPHDDQQGQGGDHEHIHDDAFDHGHSHH